MALKSQKKKKVFGQISIFTKLVLISAAFTAFPVLLAGFMITFSYQQAISVFFSMQGDEMIRMMGEELVIVLQNLRMQAMFTLLIVIVLSLFSSILIARSLVRPLKKLIGGVKRVGQEDFDFELDVESEDEIGILTDNFNKMIRQLKEGSSLEEAKKVLEVQINARTKELRHLNEQLEAQVKERTEELERKLKELEKFKKLTTGRELRMVELKRELNKAKEELEELKSGNLK